MSPANFTGRRRRRATSAKVLIAERMARLAISAGGMGTILAVSLIFVFLVWVVAPLFLSPEVESRAEYSGWKAGATTVAVGADETGRMAWRLGQDGVLEVRSLLDERSLVQRELMLEGAPTALSVLADGSFAAGTRGAGLVVGRLGFESRVIEDEAGVGPAAGALEPGDAVVVGAETVERTAAGQLASTRFAVELFEPIDTGASLPIRLIDHSRTPVGQLYAALHADGALRVYRQREKKNILTGQVKRTLTRYDVPFDAGSGEGKDEIVALALSGLGQHLYCIAADGHAWHFDLRDLDAPRLQEELDLLEAEGARVTRSSFLVGKTTLIVGDSLGRVSTFFPVRGEESDAPLMRAQVFEGSAGTPVVALAASTRSRLLLTGHQDGILRLYHVTSGALLLELQSERTPGALALLPKEDGLFAWGAAGADLWRIDARYPEVNFAGLARPVWYEGYPAPEHVWQSSSGTDEFEPKLGLAPLVFGTLKATFYSMLFGAPLALLAAIFSSEFLKARLRVAVKSTIELMASLPSVVLGFVAALVVAPFVEDIVPALMVSLFVVPLAVLLGAYLWQLLPAQLAVRWSGVQRFLAIGLTLPIGVGAALLLGPLWERLFFGGDVKAWLDGRAGGAFGGWFYLGLPLSALAVTLGFGRWVSPRVRQASIEWGRTRCARADLLQFGLGLVATLVLSALFALCVSSAGFDVRGGVFDTYVQGNAAIVGFAMGFAIVPIIYTLAEDALSEVPSHLREGSLGAGATHWQTAVRIVLPTATSGLFSALMIGLGRAVGETMIVLMAAGNTPIMRWNIFDGFRTLAANIAVELPEAVAGSGHYRTLFLAALVLFAMTFALNTFAELVRRRFRQRARAL